MAAGESFATIEQMEALWREMTEAEEARAEALLPVVSDVLRQEAMNRGKDLDEMLEAGTVLSSVLASVTVDIAARTLMTSTDREPMTQESQGGLGYTWSGTFLVPGGGLFVKDSELKRLGLKKQELGAIEWHGYTGNDSNAV